MADGLQDSGRSVHRGIGMEMSRVGFANLGPSLPAISPQQAKSALAGGPVMPLVQDDRLRRGEIYAAQLHLGLGLGLGGPWVAQGWPKRRPRATQGPRERRMEEVPLFATKVGKGRAGEKRSGDLVIARDRVATLC